jgi:hypothetical protein
MIRRVLCDWLGRHRPHPHPTDLLDQFGTLGDVTCLRCPYRGPVERGGTRYRR